MPANNPFRSLEAKGLVERQVSPNDARVSLISLSSDGEIVVGQLQNAVAETINEILDPISQADKEQLKSLLQFALN